MRSLQCAPFVLAAVVAVSCSSSTQPPPPSGNQSPHGDHGRSAPAAERTTLLGNLGSFSRPIKTTSPDAQKFFDEGLTLLYGFNHEESFRSFARAAALDPASPMPHWGMSLALGTNINDAAPADRLQTALTYLSAAQSRAANGSAVEQGLIAALALRYVADASSDQASREQAYSDAMGALSATFSDDPDVATLYAESLMNLRPWRFYDAAGTPAPGTETIVRTLERVMAAHPDHPGANHYYIHAVEASRTPDRATTQARRLETLVPGAGHLVHMPAHIYMRTGQYAQSARSNADAAKVDESYLKATGAQGMYPLMYYGHNLQFESSAAMFAGSFVQARAAARKTIALLEPVAGESPMLEPFTMQEAVVLLRFGRWDDALAGRAAAPPPERTVQMALHHYVRGAALVGKGDHAAATREAEALDAAYERVPADLMISATNTGRGLLDVARADLAGRIAAARGDREAAIAAFTRAVDVEGRLGYNEPPDWQLPERERLGALLLQAGRTADAERVFREDLAQNVGNPRALYGLWRSLDLQKKAAASEMRKSFDTAWQFADVTLGVDLLGGSR